MSQGGCDGAGVLAYHTCTSATGILLRPSGECAEYNTPGLPLDFPLSCPPFPPPPFPFCGRQRH
eukprot:2100989-Prorocentrum_lima.AAC.1